MPIESIETARVAGMGHRDGGAALCSGRAKRDADAVASQAAARSAGDSTALFETVLFGRVINP
jgi:hypothetical protein